MNIQHLSSILIYFDRSKDKNYNDTHCDEDKLRTGRRRLIYENGGEFVRFVENNSNTKAKGIANVVHSAVFDCINEDNHKMKNFKLLVQGKLLSLRLNN